MAEELEGDHWSTPSREKVSVPGCLVYDAAARRSVDAIGAISELCTAPKREATRMTMMDDGEQKEEGVGGGVEQGKRGTVT